MVQAVGLVRNGVPHGAAQGCARGKHGAAQQAASAALRIHLPGPGPTRGGHRPHAPAAGHVAAAGRGVRGKPTTRRS